MFQQIQVLGKPSLELGGDPELGFGYLRQFFLLDLPRSHKKSNKSTEPSWRSHFVSLCPRWPWMLSNLGFSA